MFNKADVSDVRMAHTEKQHFQQGYISKPTQKPSKQAQINPNIGIRANTHPPSRRGRATADSSDITYCKKFPIIEMHLKVKIILYTLETNTGHLHLRLIEKICSISYQIICL